MRKNFTLLTFLFMLFTIGTWAADSTWSFKWDTNRSSGGEGFYNISDHSQLIQVQMLNGLQWTLNSDSHATGYTATSGQYFGSATYPITHGTLSTNYLKGKIKSVSFETKVKDAAQDVKIAVSVGGVNYGNAVSPTTTQTVYTCTPDGEAQEGEIVFTFDQQSDTKGIIYFYSMSIVYEGEGVTQPVVEKVSPQLSFAATEVTVMSEDMITNPLTNPFNVSPVTYSSSDETIATVSKTTGQVFSMGPLGTAVITATFEGNDNYLAETANYTLNVIAKPVIPAPEVDVKGGSFTEPVTVTITSNDPLCKAIWYSTTITNVDDLGYDDETIIVPGNKAVVTIDKTCSLLAVAVGDNNVGLPALYDFVMNIPLKAQFTAEESSTPYYTMGWDSVEEASTWHYYGINERTWTLTSNSAAQGVGPFTMIDPSSQYSLSINYSNSDQRERAVSPEIDIKPNSKLEFYSSFSGVWLYWGCWKLYINDTASDTKDLLLNSFMWAQDNEYTGPNWEKFTVDLAKYAGHKCTFEFIYEGSGGEDMSIDGFKILQQDDSADAHITIMQGQSVHFRDLSTGEPEAWTWTFEGGEPSTSDEQNPIVTYNKAGEYTVTLTVAKGNSTDTSTRQKYVIVNVEAPKAHIGIPEGAYLSPWAYAFVPTNVPLTYKDESTGKPDTWAWQFEGTDIKQSSEQTPTVTYESEGKYGLELVVSNSAGSDRDFLVEAIHAGGSEDIWNITPEETTNLSAVGLGWYGNYAGSNWLGMAAFAEKFSKPIVSGSIDNVTAYFYDTTADDQNADIVVSICKADAAGMPGETIGQTSLKVSELAVDDNDIVPTVFNFANPITVDTDFFIVISGFPNSGYNDAVSLFCSYRGGEGKNTSYHFLLDEDENYDYLDTGKWYANEDDALSMCLTAHFTYDNKETGINTIPTDSQNGVYNINGMRVNKDIKALGRGIYIERNGNTVRKMLVK